MMISTAMAKNTVPRRKFPKPSTLIIHSKATAIHIRMRVRKLTFSSRLTVVRKLLTSISRSARVMLSADSYTSTLYCSDLSTLRANSTLLSGCASGRAASSKPSAVMSYPFKAATSCCRMVTAAEFFRIFSASVLSCSLFMALPFSSLGVMASLLSVSVGATVPPAQLTSTPPRIANARRISPVRNRMARVRVRLFDLFIIIVDSFPVSSDTTRGARLQGRGSGAVPLILTAAYPV